MSATLSYTSTLIVQDCCNCGMTFAVPADFDERRRDDHGRFYCPAGHGQSYTGPSAAEKERKRAARLEQQLASREEDLRVERASHGRTKGRLTATKGQLTKTRKRVGNGVCPCCNRSFANLGRHMSGQHPEYAEAHA